MRKKSHPALDTFRESVYRRYMDENKVREILRKEVKKAGTQQDWAYANKITRSFVSEVLKGRKGFSKKILDALGIEIDYRFKKRNRV